MTSAYLDHSVVITRQYEQVWSDYERLGFTLSPASRHKVTTTPGGPLVPSCTANRCAYFGESYIELIGIVDETAPDPWHAMPLIEQVEGLRGVSFGLGDSDAALARLQTAGLAGSGVLSLQRPVDTPTGSRIMRARSVHIDRSKTPEGILHTAEHLTPEYVHQPQYLKHANGAQHLAAVLLVVEDAELPAYREKYSAILDRPAAANGPLWTFQLRVGRIDLIPASALEEVLPGETAPMRPFFVAQAVAVADLGAARAFIEANDIPTRTLRDGFSVPSSALTFQ